MSNTYDAIVIGVGHNGLVSAAYLARSGARTLVLQSRGALGGATTTGAPWAMLASIGSAIDPQTADRLSGNGIPVLENARSGIAALGHLACWPVR
jgi:glycine/D-amino acid oxidase-like deaminating enzyme